MDPYKVSPELYHTRKYRKKLANIFSSLGRLPFLSKIYVLNNLIVPTEMIKTPTVVVRKPRIT